MKTQHQDIKVIFPDINKMVNDAVKNQPMIFKIEGKELETFKKWDEEHKKKCKAYKKDVAIGGRLSFIFTPTSVGDAIVAKCICGKKVNITDINSW